MILTDDQRELVAGMLETALTPPPKVPASEWCAANLEIPTPPYGPLSWNGREYLRECVDDIQVSGTTDMIMCFGAQLGKTTAIMASACWVIANNASWILWVMPNENLAKAFASTRWIPMLDRSKAMASLLPVKNRKNLVAKLQQHIGSAVVSFGGSNSPANLASRPARIVILDEVDKFNEGTSREADAVYLAEQRTKSFPNPKRIKVSTPTLVSGLIWQELLKGDMRRYFVACPVCEKRILFGWSPEFTVLPKIGCEAWIKWDKEAKREDGSWDMDRVDKSARFECPHCGGHIYDYQKMKMIRQADENAKAGGMLGWQPTNDKAARGYVSRHLPSFYASSVETSLGMLARKFLVAKGSLQGLQGFINGELAEPWENQDQVSKRTEIIITSPPEGEPEVKSWKFLTVDCQGKAPWFWYVVREWTKHGCTGLEAGPCDTDEDIRDIQIKHGVPDNQVMLDSGFDASEVYKSCLRWGRKHYRRNAVPLWIGWMPSKGQDRKYWKNADGILVPWHLQGIDPWLGDAKGRQNKIEMKLFEFAQDTIKDMLHRLRRGRVRSYQWGVLESMATQEYWRHLDCEVKRPEYNRKTGKTEYRWRPRSDKIPNHLFDCEVMQLVFAMFFQCLSFVDINTQDQEENGTETA